MYQVSNAFIEAMKSPVQEHRLTGTIGSISFSEANVVDGSFSISNQSTDTSDVVLGSCYVGQLTAEFTGINIAYGSWINKTITPTFALNLGNNTWESVPLGVFKVKEAKHTDHGVQVTAYDNMIKFDKKFRKSHYMNLSGMWNIISQICTDAGVTLGMTRAQIEALPNGDRTGINIYGSTGKKAEFANDITTLRDLLFWVAQTLGCFATINRAGQLEFRQYTQDVVDNISNVHRIEGATFADYITHYVGIYVENLDDNTEDYYGYDVTALQQELTETMSEITEDQEDITDLEADRADWVQKLANHECTQQEYDAAIAEIDAQEKALTKEINQLSKRAEWLSKAIDQSADDGSDMVLGANPLTMAKNKTTRDQQRREILGALSDISYTPFSASVICGCIYDLGDVIQFSGGLYNSSTDSFGCVMSYTYTHNGGTELEGYGVDPAIPMIRTKEQKETDRAQRNTYDSAQNTVGTIDPSDPPTADDSVPGKNGDMYVQETHKTPKTNVSKTFSCYETYYDAINNLYWYSYDNVKITCNVGNFIVCTARTQTQARRTWVVAGSKSRNVEWVRVICKVPVGAQAPTFTCEVSDVEEFNNPPPPPFQQIDPGGFGDETGTPFTYNGVYIENNAHTYRYYYATFGFGTWVGSLRYENNEPDYVFESVRDLEDALKADAVTIPELYDGADTNHVYYNNGTGGDNSWKKVATVSNVSESEDAGGAENNGMVINQETQEISLKKNVVRAWYKPDPPQVDMKFSQLCVRYTGSPDKQVNVTAYETHEWQNDKITKDDDSVLKIKCKGTTDGTKINYAVYAITGLTLGKKYYFNFKCKFAAGTSFDFDMTKGCGLVFNTSGTLNTGNWSGDEDKFYPATNYYAFKRTNDAWYADFELTAKATTMYMCVVMQAVSGSSNFTMSEFVISQKERELIRNIYLYDYTAKTWLKYKPFSGSTSGGDEGGSVVSIEPTISEGTKIADFSIDGVAGALYAPDGGASDYDDLSNKPSVNGVTLSGNKTSSDLGIVITLTQAQYNALTTEQKNDPNKVYYISDASGGGSTSPLFIDSSGYISIDYDLVRRES